MSGSWHFLEPGMSMVLPRLGCSAVDLLNNCLWSSKADNICNNNMLQGFLMCDIMEKMTPRGCRLGRFPRNIPVSRGTSQFPAEHHRSAPWALLGSPGLAWALLGSLLARPGSPGRSCALLGSCGLSWARLGSPGLSSGSSGLSWAPLPFPGLS